MHPLIEFTPPPDEPGRKSFLDILDNSGLDYRLGQPGRSVRVSCGRDAISDPTPRQLITFLQVHGGRFEDS
jgi:hypothetical protein